MELPAKLEAAASELGRRGLYHPTAHAVPDRDTSWQVGTPFAIPKDVYDELQTLGRSLFRFVAAVNDLYMRAQREPRLQFALTYLDQGKGETIISSGRLRRLRRQLPLFLRPDVMLGPDGLWISEIDSVPGGFGSLAAMQTVYEAQDLPVLGGAAGIREAFMEAAAFDSGVTAPTVGIVVSEESADYRPEMANLAADAQAAGQNLYAAEPKDVVFSEDGLEIDGHKLDVLYRFFELFDIKNVPKSDLFLYAARKQTVRMTPPVKAYLEEKMLFALFQHPALQGFFQESMGDAAYNQIASMLPPTWIVDPRANTPQAFIHGLEVDGRPIGDFAELKTLSKRERQFVLKPSGFSPLGWGSRGVRVGPDLPSETWAQSVDEAMQSYPDVAWVLQKLMPTRLLPVQYLDQERGTVAEMQGRIRLNPYYMAVGDDEVRLAGALVTAVPADKKLIHGMVDAVMMPAAAIE